MRVVMSLSGGMDSATLLRWYQKKCYDIFAVGFTYGSKHNEYENKAAVRVAKYFDVPYTMIDLTSVMSSFKSDLLKSGGDIPEGHYTNESMSSTVVPGRNMIFATVLAGFAWSVDARFVALGIHKGDHAIYPDCREQFFNAMNTAVELGTDGRVQLQAPFLNTDKTGLLKYGIAHDVPYGLTRTCYKDQEISCGKCGSCVERLEAFAINEMIDPIKYEEKL